MIIVLVGIATGALVGFAIYRQVRAHLELRRSLDALEKKGNLVFDHLASVIEALESLNNTEQNVFEDVRSPMVEDIVYGDVKGLESYSAFYMEEFTLLDRALRSLPYGIVPIQWRLSEHLSCLESPEARSRIWLEEDRGVQHIEPAYTR